jgi:N-acetylmuramoyl-L-alanine amidase
MRGGMSFQDPERAGPPAGAAAQPDPHPMLLRIHRLRWLALGGLALAAIALGLALATGRTGRIVAALREAGAAATPGGDVTPGVVTAPGMVTAPGADADSPVHAAAPTLAPVPTPLSGEVLPVATGSLTSAANRVGIIPGHWRFDTGAVCPDGLREVDVTLDVAHRIQAILANRGIAAELLPEHDPAQPQPPLQGFRGVALVSIHVDSCSFPGLSGYKVARWRYSRVPDTDDRLVRCLAGAYAVATGLPRHDDTLSENMWNYYAFREIGADTPGAIIEMGFLDGDRALIDDHRYEMALGVADGIGCFLAQPAGR